MADVSATSVFGPLREALIAQRQQIAERLEVLNEAELALQRVRVVFGMPARGTQEAAGAPTGDPSS
jgi:hypothetical protein